MLRRGPFQHLAQLRIAPQRRRKLGADEARRQRVDLDILRAKLGRQGSIESELAKLKSEVGKK